MKSRAGLLVAATLVVAAIGGAILIMSESRPAPYGPLGTPPPDATLCVPAEDGAGTIGTHVLHNAGESPVTLTGVRLIENEHLELVDTRLAPLLQMQTVGVWSGEQPEEGTLSDRAWQASQPAVGSSLAAGEEANLVLVISGPDGLSSAEDFEVAYRNAAGSTYRYTGAMHTTLANGVGCPA